MISYSNSSYTRTLTTRDDEVEFLAILKKHAYPSLTCRRAVDFIHSLASSS